VNQNDYMRFKVSVSAFYRPNFMHRPRAYWYRQNEADRIGDVYWATVCAVV